MYGHIRVNETFSVFKGWRCSLFPIPANHALFREIVFKLGCVILSANANNLRAGKMDF